MQDDFLEILSKAQKLKNKRTKKSINIKLFSNSVINPLDKVIKYYLDKKNVSSYIEFADFNTILPSDKKINFNIGLIIWECENLFADGYSDLEKLSQKQCKEYVNTFIGNFEYFLKDLSLFQYLIIKKLNSANYISNNFYASTKSAMEMITNYYSQLNKNTKIYNLKFYESFSETDTRKN